MADENCEALAATHLYASVEPLAQALYEARHPPGEWPTWRDLQHMKTYKLTKYRQLARVALAFIAQHQL